MSQNELELNFVEPEAVNKSILEKPDLILNKFENPDTANPERLINADNILTVLTRHFLNSDLCSDNEELNLWGSTYDRLFSIAENISDYSSGQINKISLLATHAMLEQDLKARQSLLDNFITKNPDLFSSKDQKSIQLGLGIGEEQRAAWELEQQGISD